MRSAACCRCASDLRHARSSDLHRVTIARGALTFCIYARALLHGLLFSMHACLMLSRLPQLNQSYPALQSLGLENAVVKGLKTPEKRPLHHCVLMVVWIDLDSHYAVYGAPC